MAQKTTTETDAPISDHIVADVADDLGHETETVAAVLDAFQQTVVDAIDMYRELRVCAESEDVLIVLNERGYGEEIDMMDEFTDDDRVLELLEDDVDAPVWDIISRAYHAAFKTDYRTTTGKSRQESVGALSQCYPIIARKPDESKPTTGDVDVDYRIQYEHGYTKPFHFVARAYATVEADGETFDIERTFRALPDDNSDEDSDAIQVWSETTHRESDTLVNDWSEPFSLDDAPVHTRGRVRADNSDLRRWVHDCHTADFEQEYRDARKVLNEN